MLAYMTKKYRFSSAHRTHNTCLSDDRNLEVFGKCNTSHGHNYTLEVTLQYKATSDIKVVRTRNKVVEIIQDVVDQIDYTDLNEHTFFKQTVAKSFKQLNPTTENFIEIVWQEILKRLANNEDIKSQAFEKVQLYKLRLRETARNFFDYYGENDTKDLL